MFRCIRYDRGAINFGCRANGTPAGWTPAGGIDKISRVIIYTGISKCSTVGRAPPIKYTIHRKSIIVITECAPKQEAKNNTGLTG